MQYILTFMLLLLLSLGASSHSTETHKDSNLSLTESNNSYQNEILRAMASIETAKTLKEGSSTSIDITETILAQVEQEEQLIEDEIEKHLQVATLQIQEAPIPYIPNIKYSNFEEAKKIAIQEHKYLMIKVEATNCRPCAELNDLLSNNKHIKKMVNSHIKAVKINTDHDTVPMGLSTIGTPTVFLIKPDENRVVMKLQGNEAIEDLEDSLNSFVDDRYTTGLALL